MAYPQKSTKVYWRLGGLKSKKSRFIVKPQYIIQSSGQKLQTGIGHHNLQLMGHQLQKGTVLLSFLQSNAFYSNVPFCFPLEAHVVVVFGVFGLLA